jgi:GT2 family glycosyltransferase
VSRRLDIGVASYKAPEKLRRTIESIQQQSICDIRIHVIHNPSADDNATREVIRNAASRDGRVIPHWLPENIGYAGAVNHLMNVAETPYIAYADNDVIFQTRGWDEALCGYLDRFHELGIVFPGWGPKAIKRPAYYEVQWGVGCCWILSRMAMQEVGMFDDKIGHQNECDYCLRIRMAGWKCGAAPEISIYHDATATSDPASQARIDQGVREFVNKWVAYFCGKHMSYHSPNVLRWDDWPPNALHNEEYYLSKLPGLNANPETVLVDGAKMDVIGVLRPHGFYTNRSV